MPRVSETERPAWIGVLTGSLTALAVGALLVLTARAGSVALLVGVAIVQALLAAAWVFGTGLPGRNGALVIAVLAGAGADVAVSIWPDGQLGTLLIVFALAVPVMIVHQLVRAAARVRVVESLGAISLLVLAEVALPAFLQLRGEFLGSDTGGTVVAAAAAAAAAGIVVAGLVDLVAPLPHLDAGVPRGLLGIAVGAACGGLIGYLMLRSVTEFIGGRGAFAGAALAAVVGFLAVGMSFTEVTIARPGTPVVRALRPMLIALVPLAMLAPVAYILCLAVRA